MDTFHFRFENSYGKINRSFLGCRINNRLIEYIIENNRTAGNNHTIKNSRILKNIFIFIFNNLSKQIILLNYKIILFNEISLNKQ